MKKLIIPLSNSLQKATQFHFNISQDFIDKQKMKHDDFKINNLKLMVEAQYKDDYYELQFSLTGVIILTCDMCMSNYETEVWEENALLLKPSNDPEASNASNEDTDIVYIRRHLGEFNFSEYLYDYICLSVPNRKKCENVGKTDFCNQNVLSKLNKHILN